MSNLSKLVVLILVTTAIVVGWTLLQPSIIAYQVKVAARLACNQMIHEAKFSQLGTSASRWDESFRGRVSTDTGVKLERDWYEFSVERSPTGDYHCDAKIKFPVKVDWFLVSEVFELPPYQTTKTVQIVRQRVAANF